MKTDNYYLKPHSSGGFLFAQGNGKNNSLVFVTKDSAIRVIREMLREKHVSHEQAYALLLQVQIEKKLPYSIPNQLFVHEGVLPDMKAIFLIERLEIELLSALQRRPFTKEASIVSFGNQVRIVGKTFISPLLSTKLHGMMMLATYQAKGMMPPQVSQTIQGQLMNMTCLDNIPGTYGSYVN